MESKRIRLVIIAVLTVIFLLLQIRLWFGEGSIAHIKQLEREISKQKSLNDELEKKNRQLEAEIRDLKKGTEAIEEKARKELGMIKDDETFYLIIDQDNNNGKNNAAEK